jgi:hypothetical protein
MVSVLWHLRYLSSLLNGWISKEKLLESAARYDKIPYDIRLKAVGERKVLH